MSLYEEVQLCPTRSEREKIRNLAEVYALINTIQYLQKAYIKDCINEEKYRSSCRRLISQFNEAFELIKAEYPTVESFMEKYKMDCPSALKVIKDGPVAQDDGNKLLVHCTELFITALDKINLNQLAKDEIQPDISSLLDTMNRISSLPKDFDGKKKMRKWLNLMEPMSASDTLTTAQGRELLFDVESSYNNFKSIVR